MPVDRWGTFEDRPNDTALMWMCSSFADELSPRQREALELRMSGLTLEAVGDRMLITGGRARQLVESARRRLTHKAMCFRPTIDARDLEALAKYDPSLVDVVSDVLLESSVETK